MSSEYYFKKWRETLVNLERAIDVDVEFQVREEKAQASLLKSALAKLGLQLPLEVTKVHDKLLCQATERLSGVLGEYIALYNDALVCLQQNLQVQKTPYMTAVVQAVVARILELKRQLSKLECSPYQFLGNGLIVHKLTLYDSEFVDIPGRKERAEHLTATVEEVLVLAVSERERLAREALEPPAEDEEEEKDDGKDLWFDKPQVVEDMFQEVEKKLSEETLRRREMINLIGAQERTRQVIQKMKIKERKKAGWAKELAGDLNPKARVEVRQRASSIIKTVFREYFKIKRQRIIDYKIDELLDIKRCSKPSDAAKRKLEENMTIRASKYKDIENEWKTRLKEMEEDFLKRKGGDIADDYRDYLRNWFYEWFDQIKFFYDIPNAKQGGSALIFREEVPTPHEYRKIYQEYMAKQKANKGKSAEDLKQAKLQKKQEEKMAKKEALMKQKHEALLMKKLMKNPTKHPGYHYPESKKTEGIIEAIKNYREEWDEMDAEGSDEVKKGAAVHKDAETICINVKKGLLDEVDERMRQELKGLKRALRRDFETIEATEGTEGNKEQEPMMDLIRPEYRPKLGKNKSKIRKIKSESFREKMLKLAVQGIVKEFPRTKIEDFLGDPNIAGDDMRGAYRIPVPPFTGDTRSFWWERCRELIYGFHAVLLVGPHGSGKTMMVHAMATVNNAVLFEINPKMFEDDNWSSSDYLKKMINSLTYCVRAAQPAIVYLKHIHKLYYSKPPPECADWDVHKLKKYIVKKLIKGFQKQDDITVIGSCVDPWLMRSKQLLKHFPTVLMMPSMSHGNVMHILNRWMKNNRVIPANFNAESLAHGLEGYSHGYLARALQDFLTPAQITQIAAKGLQPEDVYNYIVDNELEPKPDYEKYVKWYQDFTDSGQKEKRYAKEQEEFKMLMDRFVEKNQRKARLQKLPMIESTQNSVTSSVVALPDNL